MRKQQIEKGKEIIRISKDMEEEKIHSYIEIKRKARIRPILEGKDGIIIKNE